MIKNNVTRFLESHRIPYTAYALPPEKLGAEETARLLNLPLEQIFKTIVVQREGKGKPILAIVSGASEVDLKALAKTLGEKKLRLPTERQAEQITGMQSGGISPLALVNRGFQMVLDTTANAFEVIHVSGGQRGLNISLPVKDLIAITNARVAEISRPSTDGQTPKRLLGTELP